MALVPRGMHRRSWIWSRRFKLAMSPYQLFVSALNDDELTLLARGDMGMGCDFDSYRLEENGQKPFSSVPAIEQTRELLIEAEESILAKLYATRPLCRSEFNHQATELLNMHGATSFCRHGGNRSNWALMIDEWQLIAVNSDDVRCQYGYFCEAEKSLDDPDVAAQVMRWLESGEAYDDYRSKTHCRYCTSE